LLAHSIKQLTLLFLHSFIRSFIPFSKERSVSHAQGGSDNNGGGGGVDGGGDGGGSLDEDYVFDGADESVDIDISVESQVDDEDIEFG
jgi:hypothetical protein